MTRWKAAAIHFAISLVVLTLIVGFVVWRWYPPELFAMARAGVLLSLLGGVDLVLGPLLTLLVYKTGKPSLKFDLSVIALLQIAAMAFGLHTAWMSRPAYVVAISDRFRLVFANEIDPASAKKAPAEYRHPPALGPTIVAAPLPSDPKRRLEMMLLSFSGLDISQQPAHFVAYPPADTAFLRQAVPADTVLELAPARQRSAWRQVFARHPGVGSLAILPLQSSRGSASVVLQASDGRILGYSHLDPWPVVNALVARKRRTSR
ncbi:TfpX/TfpZ family type IV pilin accessory protein [Lysobacter hankyongensis]|uniref:Pilus assembly protein n=1 Tax=Lysobacter hankyongensis TaxID=1176535 RepID=A0ABP9BGI9_9GAMM